MRRIHEDLERRWSFTVDAMSDSQVTAVPNVGQPGVNYRSYSRAESAYRLGDPEIDNGKRFLPTRVSLQMVALTILHCRFMHR